MERNRTYFKKDFTPLKVAVIKQYNNEHISLNELCYFEKYNSYRGTTTKEYMLKRHNWVPSNITAEFLSTCYDVYLIQNVKKYSLYIPVFTIFSFLCLGLIILSLTGVLNEYVKLNEYRYYIPLLCLLISFGIGVFKLDDNAVLLNFQDKETLVKSAFTSQILDNTPIANQVQKNIVDIKQNILKEQYDIFVAKLPSLPSKQESIKIINYLNRLILEDEKFMANILPLEYETIMDEIAVKEEKRLKNHLSYEGRISISDKRKIKNKLGYTCSACGINLSTIYGGVGKNCIELHHKLPYCDLKENEERILNIDDFCVLCPNCHRMIHKLDDAGDLNLLKNIIDANRKH